MKNIYLLLFAFLATFASCQQDALIEENQYLKSRAVANNTFTFIDGYIVWNEETRMLEYAITAMGNPALDSPITISYRVTASNGWTKIYSFVIAAGSTGYWEEGTTLSEGFMRDMELDPYMYYVTDVEVLGYDYWGNMEIIGLDNLDTVSPDVFS